MLYNCTVYITYMIALSYSYLLCHCRIVMLRIISISVLLYYDYYYTVAVLLY